MCHITLVQLVSLLFFVQFPVLAIPHTFPTIAPLTPVTAPIAAILYSLIASRPCLSYPMVPIQLCVLALTDEVLSYTILMHCTVIIPTPRCITGMAYVFNVTQYNNRNRRVSSHISVYLYVFCTHNYFTSKYEVMTNPYLTRGCGNNLSNIQKVFHLLTLFSSIWCKPYWEVEIACSYNAFCQEHHFWLPNDLPIIFGMNHSIVQHEIIVGRSLCRL